MKQAKLMTVIATVAILGITTACGATSRSSEKEPDEAQVSKDAFRGAETPEGALRMFTEALQVGDCASAIEIAPSVLTTAGCAEMSTSELEGYKYSEPEISGDVAHVPFAAPGTDNGEKYYFGFVDTPTGWFLAGPSEERDGATGGESPVPTVKAYWAALAVPDCARLAELALGRLSECEEDQGPNEDKLLAATEATNDGVVARVSVQSTEGESADGTESYEFVLLRAKSHGWVIAGSPE